MLKLDDFLEATDIGNGQDELAEWISNHADWLSYVEKVNAEGIPASEDDCNRPSIDWLESQTFHPDTLLGAACDALGWHSVPNTGGLLLNFY